MKFNSILTVMVSILLLLSFTASINAANEKSADQTDIFLATSPSKVFFNISNMKPGDFTVKELEIINKGKQDFSYIFTNKFQDGSEALYNELLLTFKSKTAVIYNGYLKDFDGIEPRNLADGESESLTVRVEIPYELGNEFQGLSSKFQFKVFVDGTLSGLSPAGSGLKLPNTSTYMYTFILLGAILLLSGAVLYGYNIRKRRQSAEG